MYLKSLGQKWLIVGQWLSKLYYFHSIAYCAAIKVVYLKKFNNLGECSQYVKWKKQVAKW